jgi:peptide/nickel transport system permease protein
MTTYALQRLLLTVPTMLGLSIIIFILVRIIPGDAALLQATGDASGLDPAALEQLRRQMGLDKPWPLQYLDWLGGILRGDFGTSLWSKEPAFTELLRRVPVTLELALGSILVSTIFGLLIGIGAAVYRNHAFDYLGRLFGTFGLSVPNFWTGTLIIVLPAVWWGYIPPLGYVSPFEDLGTNLRQFVGPCLALGWALSASVMRMTRSQMLEVLRHDYVQTARAKGLQERLVVYRHALKNVLIPVISITGLQIGFLLGGTVVVESVFALPGIGTLTLQAISQRDYPTIQANVLFVALLFVLVNLVTDLAYGWLDPRVRQSQ